MWKNNGRKHYSHDVLFQLKLDQADYEVVNDIPQLVENIHNLENAKVMSGVKDQGDLMDLIRHQFISLLLHVNKTIHSFNMTWHPEEART